MDIFLPWLPVIFMILGLLFGSFINVVIYRLPLMMGVGTNEEHSKISLWWPPSHCPHCEKPVKPWDNIPVLSWLMLKGHCRHCKSNISAIYPISEFTIGMIYFVLATSYQDSFLIIQIAVLAALITILYAAAVIDFEHMLLPDSLVFSVLWGGLLFSAAGLSSIELKDAVFGVVCAWFVLWCVMSAWEKILKYQGLGNGDVKLYAAATAWLGWQNFPALLLISAVFGVLFYLVVHISTKFSKKANNSGDRIYLPFGPAIIIAMLVILFGEVL